MENSKTFKNKLTAVKGMNDLLPHNSYQWLWLTNKLQDWLQLYAYSYINTPILEYTDLFKRSIGEFTDIVEKEMYSFIDGLNGDKLTMRPEGTASVMRLAIEHNLLYNNTQKFWYLGPMFRHEKPQKGRYRQFHQLGVEALGFKDCNIDTEMIQMLHHLWQILGLNNVELHINCLGNTDERLLYRETLIKYFEQHLNILDEDAKRRLYENPLRILDSKNPKLLSIINAAPSLLDFLSTESLEYYNSWKIQLSSLGIKFTENTRLVRGLDYYNLSVFEWIINDANNLLGSQSTIAAGGRYDGLYKLLAHTEESVPAIGFAVGLERLLFVLEQYSLLPAENTTDIFIANMLHTESNVTPEQINIYSFKIASLLRQNNFTVIQNFNNTSIKSQFKKANTLKIKYVIIIGVDELQTNTVMLKYMDTGVQFKFTLTELLAHLINI